MKSKALMDAIKARWDAAGLDDSIADLYPAGESPRRGRNSGGSPEGSSLPRAEYMLSVQSPSNKTRASLVRQAVVTFRVWGTQAETVADYLDDIADAFRNADAAGTDPMTMSGGTVMEVEEGGGAVEKQDDALHMGQKMALIRYREANAVPA